MAKRFVCRFAVGQDGVAYSGIWRVWTQKNKPGLYLAVEKIVTISRRLGHSPPNVTLSTYAHLFKKDDSKAAAAINAALA